MFFSVHIVCILTMVTENTNCFFVKGTVSRNRYIVKGLNILVSTFCVCNGFQGLSKAFHCPIQLETFYLLLWNYLLILKMLAETFLRIPFSVIGQRCCWPLISCRENVQELTCYRRLPAWFYRTTGGSCKHFQSQNLRFWAFEGDYSKGFSKLASNFTEAS
jgi:hypothetical protein